MTNKSRECTVRTPTAEHTACQLRGPRWLPKPWL